MKGTSVVRENLTKSDSTGVADMDEFHVVSLISPDAGLAVRTLLEVIPPSNERLEDEMTSGLLTSAATSLKTFSPRCHVAEMAFSSSVVARIIELRPEAA